jgi:hypothetical protein
VKREAAPELLYYTRSRKSIGNNKQIFGKNIIFFCAIFFGKKFDIGIILWYNSALGIRLRAAHTLKC